MRKSGSRRRRRATVRLDTVRFPLFYILTAGTSATTTVATLADTFDRSRAFRVSSIQGEVTAFKAPVFFYFEVFGPVSTADNIWASPVHLAVQNQKTRFRYRIPGMANLWYPSGSSSTTPLIRIMTLCESKDVIGMLNSITYATVMLRPVEPNTACVRQIQPVDCPGPSGLQSTDREEERFTILSSDDDYFST